LCALVLATHHVANAISRTEGRATTKAPTMSGDETSIASAKNVCHPTADAIGVDVPGMTVYLPRAARS